MTDFCKSQINVNPDVKAFRVLIRAPQLPEKTASGLILTDDTKDIWRKNINIGLVLKVGPLAFKGEMAQHFKCEVGDWVSYSRYEREEFWVPKDNNKHNDILCYYINDERIHSVINQEDIQTFLRGAE